MTDLFLIYPVLEIGIGINQPIGSSSQHIAYIRGFEMSSLRDLNSHLRDEFFILVSLFQGFTQILLVYDQIKFVK